jgi:hypothetical protein
MGVVVSDSGKFDVRMSCEDYRFLLVAGPYRKDLPPAVRELMSQHKKTCSCFNSPGSHQDAINIMVSPAMEEAALKIVEQYNRLTICFTGRKDMAFSLRNLQKFIQDTPVLANKEAEIMARAKELAGEDNNVLSGSAAQDLIGLDWATAFFNIIITDPEHLKMAMEDLRAAR